VRSNHSDYESMANMSPGRFNTQAQMDSVTKWRIETDKDIKNYENLLLGRVLNSRTNQYEEVINGLRICDEKGVAFARLALNSVANKSSLQGNFSQERYEQTMIWYGNLIIKQVGIFYKDYGIDKKNRDSYIHNLLGMISVIMTRAMDDKERDYASKSTKETWIQRLTDLPFNRGGQQRVL
jgi:hypothetical protein